MNKYMCAIAIQVRFSRSERERCDKDINGEMITAPTLKFVYDPDDSAVSNSLYSVIIGFEVILGVC
jgi:hypothetical protein